MQRIDYIEFSATNIAATKQFYAGLFGWTFEDYGPDYTGFQDGRIAGGFAKGEPVKAGGHWWSSMRKRWKRPNSA